MLARARRPSRVTRPTSALTLIGRSRDATLAAIALVFCIDFGVFTTNPGHSLVFVGLKAIQVHLRFRMFDTCRIIAFCSTDIEPNLSKNLGRVGLRIARKTGETRARVLEDL
jgi:hypothetical protein